MNHRSTLRQSVPADRRHVHVAGMQGLGDNIHQRGIVRQLLQAGRTIWLETPWPCLYHDLVGPRLHLVAKDTKLPVYAKNAKREADRYSSTPWPANVWPLKIWYSGADVRAAGSVLGAMCRTTGTRLEAADFRLPIPAAWARKAAALIDQWKPDRPIMLYRPLVERSWWGGCVQRNPDHDAYAALVRSIRERFFVVSVADLEPGVEWMVGERIDADVELHHGELEIETLAALTAASRLVFTSPGFAVILAQAVGTPSCVVFGGYENSISFSAGARWAPYLGIDTLTPCGCFSHAHACDKRIDLPAAIERLAGFVQAGGIE